MILKDVDDKTNILKGLKSLLFHPKIFDTVKDKIKNEIYMIEKGWENEKNAAYYINHYYRERKNTVVLHNLRLKLDDKFIQIDHLLLGKLFVAILESKYFNKELIYKNGFFSIKTNNGFKDIPDPILQTERQIDNFKQIGKNLGIDKLISNNYINFVLISPNTHIASKVPDKIIKADMIDKKIDEYIDKAGIIPILKMGTSLLLTERENLINAGKILIKHHTPYDIDFYLKKLKLEWVKKDLEIY